MALNLRRRVSVSTHSTQTTVDFSAQAVIVSLLSTARRLREAIFATGSMNVRFWG
jgi:hypothetical protein